MRRSRGQTCTIPTIKTHSTLGLIILAVGAAASLYRIGYYIGTTLNGLPGDNDRGDSLSRRDITEYDGTSMPKILWMYWDKGFDHLKSLSNVTKNKYAADYSCVRAMMELNPSWDIRILDENNAKALAPIYSSLLDNETLYPKLTPTMKGDTLRLELLSRYGGVYADTSVCPFVGLDDFIPKWVGTDKNGFWANPSDMANKKRTNLSPHVAMCHDHSRVPKEYRGVRNIGKGAPFRTSSNWFMASTNPHNPLVDEWLEIYANHLLTLPDPTTPYFLAHCALTQARMKNETVDNIWTATMKREAEAKMRRIRDGPSSEKRACRGAGGKNNTEFENNCAIVKKPSHHYVLSGDYWKYIQTKSDHHPAAKKSKSDKRQSYTSYNKSNSNTTNPLIKNTVSNQETNNTVNCGSHFDQSCAECNESRCLGDCEWYSRGGVCQLRSSLIVRLASSESSVIDNCTFFYVRVPKTGSTSIHNTIVQDKNASQKLCSQKKHVPIPVLDNKYHVGTFLVTVRDPYERFISQYRYMYGNTAHASKALQLSFKAKYRHINDLVLDLKYAQHKFLNTLYWMRMTQYVPLEWIKDNRKSITYLCASSNSSTLHEQLEKTLGIEIEGMPAHHNPTEGIVHGVTANFTVLSEKSRKILAGSFLKSDLELYKLSGCSMFTNKKSVELPR